MEHNSVCSGVLFIVVLFKGDGIIPAMVQAVVDYSDDEHLHDHHLLT